MASPNLGGAIGLPRERDPSWPHGAFPGMGCLARCRSLHEKGGRMTFRTNLQPRTRIEVGETAAFTKTISETDVILFAGSTGDMNPFHINEEYARQMRFGRRIAHGMLVTGLISAVMGMKLPGPGTIYLHQELDFRNPVYIGDTITAVATVLHVREDKPVVTLSTTIIWMRN